MKVAVKTLAKKMLTCFEMSMEPVMGSDGSVLLGIPHWEVSCFKNLSTSKIWNYWFKSVGYSGVIQTARNDEYQMTRVFESGNCLYYQCPETLEQQAVDRLKTTVYQVHEQRFIRYVNTLLASPEYQPDIQEVSTLPNVMWTIGRVYIKNCVSPLVYLVRQLDNNKKEVIDVIKQSRRPAIILSTGQNSSGDFVLPSNATLKCLVDGLVDDHQKITLDKKWLLDVSIKATRDADTSEQPVSFDEEKHVLFIKGKSSWRVTGERRIAAVKYMYQQFLLGREELPAREILDAIKTPGQVGGAVRMQSLFASSANWEDFITSKRRGYYTFNI